MGNVNGLYHGVNRLNQAQLDRWNIIASLDYLDPAEELLVVTGQVPEAETRLGEETVATMIEVAQLTRSGFAAGDVELAFRFSFLNRCDATEHPLVAEYYQRCFGGELDLDQAATAS